MLLPTGLPTRRKFLERSVLGAGSLLVAPMLLDSCTDHTIPGPDTPITPPPLDDSYDIDWNNLARETVITGLKFIPQVGGILSGLTGIFWPTTKVDVWGQVKAQTEALVELKLTDFVYQMVSDDLQGLNNSITLYLNELKNGTPSDIKTQWIVTKNLFVTALPHFQTDGYQYPLLGLFAQFANLYLSLLRDPLIPTRNADGSLFLDTNGKMVLTGTTWGRSDADLQQDIKDLQAAITGYTNYTNSTFENARNRVNYYTIPNNHACEPFRTVNALVRGLTLMVLEYLDTWKYYDVTVYPNGSNETDVYTREIYSDPYGTCDNSGPINIPSPPTQFPTNLTVWSGNLNGRHNGEEIDAVQLTYPANSGPGGVTTTPRMGTQEYYPYPDERTTSFTMTPANPIVKVKVASGDIIDAMQFEFYDGTVTTIVGVGNVNNNIISYTNKALSSVHINGESKYYYSADSVVFGFKYWQSPAATLKAIQNMYVTSPKEHSMADFAKAFPNLALPAGLITAELKAARAAYWAYIEARAKALK